MKLSDISFGAPFTIGRRVFYKLYPHFPLSKHGPISYECYEVIKGCLQSPAHQIPEFYDVEPYQFSKDVKDI